ncbi:putative uncharacterized protein DDB_G0282133 [Chelonus insularis]|uniref:putative uncharacterized protein DDB_G0282133 n=1 Tax=Chelonus insularis TaxID=460826 RepID=UPI00158D2867|nr:putative uncharacterized protein DDB_G0282133 [Chelonus insularis]
MELTKHLENLVNLSLMTKSTSIAIRIHFKNKRLQIIDNGNGIPNEMLQLIGDKIDVNKDHRNFIESVQKHEYIYEYWHQVLLGLRVCASTLLIMTKYLSGNTYCKILKFNYPSSIKKIKNRPTSGTTCIIYFTRNSKLFIKIFTYKSIIERIFSKAPQVSYSIVINDDNKKHVFGKKKFSGEKTKKFEQSRSYFHRTYYPTFGKFITHSPGKINKDRSPTVKRSEKIQLNKKIKSILKTANKNREESNDEIKNRNNNNKNNERQCSFTIASLRSHNAFNHNKDTKNTMKDNNNIINDNKNQCSFTTMNTELQTELNNDDNNMINYINSNNTNINCDMKKYSFPTTSSSRFNHESDSTDISNDKINTPDLNDNQKQYAFIQTGLESYSELNNDDNLNCDKLDDDENDHVNGEKLCIEVNPHDFDLSGEWSDWILESPRNELDKISEGNNDSNLKTINKKRYSFLPEKLNNLLPKNSNKLSTRKLSGAFRENCNLKFNLPRRQDDDVRLCNVKRGKDEITMDKKILQQIKVLNQVNLEFIACIAEYNNKKLLILIDQHAMDERIRYENLIDGKKTENNKLKSVTLKQSIKITELPINYANLLQINRSLLENFGINFTISDGNIANNSYYKSHDYATLFVKTIPKCLSGKKYKNCIDLTHSVRELLSEITEKLCNNIGVNRLPLTIHNAIASEACHGAIRFGDPLNLKQCNDLVSYWIETDLPNRCAHGRPVVIPLLFIDPLYKNQHNLTKVCSYFIFYVF